MLIFIKFAPTQKNLLKKKLYSRNIHFALSCTVARFFLFFIFLNSTFSFSQSVKDSVSGIILIGNATIINHHNENVNAKFIQIQDKISDGIQTFGAVTIFNAENNHKHFPSFKNKPVLIKNKDLITTAIINNAEKIQQKLTENIQDQKYYFARSENPSAFHFGNIASKNNATITFSNTSVNSKFLNSVVKYFNLKELELAFQVKTYNLQFNNKEEKLFCSVFVRPPPFSC